MNYYRPKTNSISALKNKNSNNNSVRAETPIS